MTACGSCSRLPTVAGIAAALARDDDIASVVRFGVAAGTATVLTPGTELCGPDVVARLIDQVTVER